MEDSYNNQKKNIFRLSAILYSKTNNVVSNKSIVRKVGQYKFSWDKFLLTPISCYVLSVTSCPIIFNDLGATPKISQPPSVFKKAHAECIPSFNSPVVFFSSRVRDSSADTRFFISSIVIQCLLYDFCLAFRPNRCFYCISNDLIAKIKLVKFFCT